MKHLSDALPMKYSCHGGCCQDQAQQVATEQEELRDLGESLHGSSSLEGFLSITCSVSKIMFNPSHDPPDEEIGPGRMHLIIPKPLSQGIDPRNQTLGTKGSAKLMSS